MASDIHENFCIFYPGILGVVRGPAIGPRIITIWSWNIPETPHFCPKWPLTFQPVGPICPNINQTRTKQTFATSCWHSWVTTPTTQKRNRSAKGPCPNMDLTSMSWRILLSEPVDLTCISPTGHFVRPTPDIWDQNGWNLSDFGLNIYGNYPGSSSNTPCQRQAR